MKDVLKLEVEVGMMKIVVQAVKGYVLLLFPIVKEN